MLERRRAPRYPVSLEAEVTEVETGAKLSGRTSDVSRLGCYIDTITPSPKGTKIVVRLKHSDEIFQTGAVVIYSSQGLGMGVAFSNFSPDQQALLDGWLATVSVS